MKVELGELDLVRDTVDPMQCVLYICFEALHDEGRLGLVPVPLREHNQGLEEYLIAWVAPTRVFGGLPQYCQPHLE